MDPYLHVPLSTRIRRLRRAVRFSRNKFARILGVTPLLVATYERANRRTAHKIRPTPYVMGRLRLMEAAFASQLRKEIRKPSGWGREVWVYPKFDGNRKKRVMSEEYKSANTMPDDPKYVDLLGGIELFRTQASDDDEHADE